MGNWKTKASLKSPLLPTTTSLLTERKNKKRRGKKLAAELLIYMFFVNVQNRIIKINETKIENIRSWKNPNCANSGCLDRELCDREEKIHG